VSKKANQQFACSKMMLPEHRGGLQEHRLRMEREETNRCPLLDEQRHEELQHLLRSATFKRQKIRFTVLNSSGRHSLCGIPLRCDSSTGLIYIDNGGSRPHKIMAASVIAIENI